MVGGGGGGQIRKGSKCTFPQELVAVDSSTLSYVTLGRVQEKFVVSPDIRNLLFP